jgi:SAM-dependent methyltransferase
MQPQSEKAGWDSTAQLLGNYQFSFGGLTTAKFRSDPSQIVSILACYKFAMRVACKKGEVLELGCGDGIGATILAENMHRYVGVDADSEAIGAAKENLSPNLYAEKYRFIAEDFVGKQYGKFAAVIDLKGTCIKTAVENLADDGLCVVGGAKVHDLKKWFHQVFFFKMHEGMVVVCTAFASPSFAVGCHKRAL